MILRTNNHEFGLGLNYSKLITITPFHDSVHVYMYLEPTTLF